jgi:DNA-binding response OmpR family regulator
MQSARDEMEQLLAAIRQRAGAPDVARLTDQISVLCRAALTPSLDESWTALKLTKMEARVMRSLAERSGRTVSKGALMDALYFDRPREAEPKIVDVMVCKIRRKLKGSAWIVETIWGQGYRARFTPETVTMPAAPAEKMMAA